MKYSLAFKGILLSLHMTTTKGTTVFSKIRRLADKTHIHNLFIFNKTGICLFRLNFSDSFQIEQEQLISSFFTALMSFTKELIGNKIKALEMGDVKLVIIEQSNLYYGLLCDSLENLMMLEDIISKIHVQFMKYVNRKNINIGYEYIFDDNLSEQVENVVNDILSNEFDFQKEDKIVEFINDLALSREIGGIMLLTDKGKVIYSTLKKIDMKNFLREVDFRVKICNNNILKLFYTSKNGELIFSEYVGELYLVILVFDSNVKFGLAEYYLHKLVNYIKNLLGVSTN